MPATHANAGISASREIAVKGNAEIRSFAQALAFLKEHGHADQAVVGTGTTNVKLKTWNAFKGHVEEIALVLYDTPIAKYREDETYTTSSGGFLTPTTVSRLNQFTPGRYGRHDRTLWNRGVYGDAHANRFHVQPGPDGGLIIDGPEAPAPRLKRGKADGPHGTLRWLVDGDGQVISTNDRHPGEAVFEVLLYDKIGQGGDYSRPLEYELTREAMGAGGGWMRGLRGMARSDVPLEVANAHRKLWGMPEIEVVGG